jgi:hypothetical protein
MVGASIFAILIFKHQTYFHDDAYITLRYARNFAETGLIQWNPGEWVEGYTSVLHVWLTGWLIRLGASAVFASQLVNALAASVLAGSTLVAARTIAPGREGQLARALTVVIVAGSAPFAIWVLGGLEAVVVAALLMAGSAALLAQLHRTRPVCLGVAAVLFSLAVLTRLDASVFIAGAGLGVLAAGAGSLGARFLCAVLVVGMPAAVAFTQMGIRWTIYGELFPLTFYAKADLPFIQKVQSGAEYLAESPFVVPTIGLAALLAVFMWFSKSSNRPSKLLTCALLPQLLYVIWAGGDHMPAARMLVPLIAPSAVLLLALSTQMADRIQRMLLGVTTAAVLVLSLIEAPYFKDPAALIGEIVGSHIDAEWPEGITIALNTAGSTPFVAGNNRVFIDMLGLNDPVIAKRQNVPMLALGQGLPGHTKGDGAYVLSRQPDRIIIGPAYGVDVAGAWFLSGVEMAALPEFKRCYRKESVQLRYGDALIWLGVDEAEPILFTYYVRVCA